MTGRSADGLLRCARCRGWFPPGAFHRSRKSATGRDSYCSPCRNEYTRAWIERQDFDYNASLAARRRGRRQRLAEEAERNLEAEDAP